MAEPNQVWAADFTYLPMVRGFLCLVAISTWWPSLPGGHLYLVAIMDWHSRYVLAWQLSNTLEADFCVETLLEALGPGRPEIFNTDRGSQFTQVLRDLEVRMGRGGTPTTSSWSGCGGR